MTEKNKTAGGQAADSEVHPASLATRREGPSAGLIGGDVDIQVRTAKTFPREISKFKQQAHEMVAVDKETAESCSYAFKRGGKIIEGPSARLAEIVAASWGNLRVAAKTTGSDEGFIYAESVCWDLESNVAVSYETRRRITNKDGQRFNDDMVGVTGNATTSIAFRNSVFRVVPRAYVNEVWMAARKVAAGGQTLEQKRNEMLNWFKDRGVTEKQILDLLNISALDGISKEQLAMLRGFAQSIKDGVTSIESIFNNGQPIDPQTIDQPETVIDESQPSGSQAIGQTGDSLDAQKSKLIDQICTELGQLHPGDSIEAQAARLKTLNHVFGKTVLDEIVKLPVQILEAGLGAMRSKAAATEDISV